MEPLLLAHDLGTSGNKATLYRADGTVVGFVQKSYPVFYPHDEWAEQDPEDWWRAVCVSTRALLEKTGADARCIAGISFSAQMMGCLLVDKDGTPLRPMITWADTRAAHQEKQIIERVGMERVYRITGHRASASYSAAKLMWVRDNEPGVFKQAAWMLHAKDYIIYRLTGNVVTDYSDASGTNLFDIREKCWSREILEALQLPAHILPPPHPSTDIVGTVSRAAAEATGLVQGTPVVAGGGDGSCACVGANVVQEGAAYCVMGSSAWISRAKKQPVLDAEMRTFNWVHLDPALYTPCGTMQAAGVSYQWYRNVFCADLVEHAKAGGDDAYARMDRAAAEAPVGSGGVLFLPYLLGERSPRWNHAARGTFVGLSVSTDQAALSRAVMEGIGLNLRVILEILDGQQPVDSLTLIGGGAKSKIWPQILADIWQKPLELPAYQEEATSIGAARCAGVGVGLYPDFVSACRQRTCAVQTVRPNPDNAGACEKLYRLFNETYAALCPVYEGLAQLRAK